ncbi:MAG: TRAP transporter substrate-binding protein DctP [Planctomycetota bacterium]|nr:TRAP transporter substrate-binding protein DctP [Planctomycetota bacterium]
MSTNPPGRAFGWSALAAAFAVLAVLALAPAPARAQAPTRVKLATLAPTGSSFHQILQAMAEKWKAAPGGGANVTIYTDGRMGGEADMVKRMRVGQLNAAMLSVTGLAEIDDSVTALQNLPMMFRSLDEVDYVREQLRTVIERKFEAKGFIVLFWGDAGWVYFYSRKPGAMPDDFKPMKMFSWAGDNQTADRWREAGFHPVLLEPTDILTGLQTGLIDVVSTPPVYALAGQFYGPAPHMLELPWAPLVGGTVISKKTWDSMSPAARAVMLKAAQEAGDQIRLRSRVESAEAIEAMKKRGLKVTPANAEVTAAWRAASEAMYPKIRGTTVPADLFDRVTQLLAQRRAAEAAAAAAPAPATQPAAAKP